MLRLYQFECSHFCEKARWILDSKRVAYEKETLLPGFHVPRVRAMTGQQRVPVLDTPDEGRVVGTNAIADYAERIGRGPALLPPDPEARRRALELQDHFEPIGHHARRALFSVLFAEPEYALACMAGTTRGPARTMYGAMFFATRRIISKVYDLSADRVAASTQATIEALDFVAETLDGGDYLVGDTFTIADLSAAALLVPVAIPKDAQIPFPPGRPASLDAFLARFADHAAVAWVDRMFARHRMLDVGRAE